MQHHLAPPRHSNVSLYISRTNGLIDGLMLLLDSAHQKSLETPIHELSDCSGDASTDGGVDRIPKIGK